MSSASNNNEQPSLISGHATYVKGAAEEAIGNLTGAGGWKEFGTNEKKLGLEEMKAAGEQRDSSKGFGKAEELAGKAVGCEGMEQEGKESKSS